MGWFGGYTFQTYSKGPGGYEAVAAGQAAVGMSANLIKPTTGPYAGVLAKAALVSLEGGDVRFRIDGGNPTGTDGHQLTPGDNLVLSGTQALRQFKVIRMGGTNGTLRVTYFY